MNKFQEIHLALPQTLLAGLDRAARDRGVRRVSLVREALASYLDQIESERRDREMENYAEALAPHSGEFVAESDQHTVEQLLSETEW